ncbi:hypothetical protein AAVH_24610 [Aphelenchoides avenae]|nr:hypothetical protein AAVH_24610 [Aphelenchus avenae]
MLTIFLFSQTALQRPLEQAGTDATCAPNEVLDECGGYDTFCHVPPRPPYDPDCRAPACVCAEGHARERNGTCVRAEDCAAPCGPNEYLPRFCESAYTWGGTCEKPDL